MIFKIYQALPFSKIAIRQQFKLQISVFNPNPLVFLHETGTVCTVSRIYLNVTLFQLQAAASTILPVFFLEG